MGFQPRPKPRGHDAHEYRRFTLKAHHHIHTTLVHNIMAQESKTGLYEALRKNLISSAGINTVEEFFRLDDSKIRTQLLVLGGEITKQFALLGIKLDRGWGDNGFPRFTHFAENNRFQPFRPLITLLLDNQAKSNQEMLELINEEFNSPPTPLSFIPTPLRTGITSSLPNSSSQLSHLLPTLKRELKDSMYTNVPGLLEHFIQKQPIDSASRLEPDESFIDLKYRETLSDTSERFMLNWITSFFIQLDKQKPKIRTSRTWKSQPTMCLEGVEAARKLDGAIMSRNLKHENHIQDVLVPVELKKNKSDAKDAAICLAKYVYEVFTAQPTRSFVIGLTLCGTSFQFWQFDRSGAIGSELFDVKANREHIKKFFALILRLLTCDEQLLGFDPTFMELQGPRTVIRIETKTGPQDLEIIRSRIFRAAGICGRGTTCWEANLSGDKLQTFLIKDSWQPLCQTEEGVMLRNVTEKNISHVAQYHHHEDVHVASKRVDIESHLRGGIDFKSGQKIQITSASVDRQVPNDFINRVHRRLILKDVGQPIWTADSPAALLEALEGCIKGHQALLDAGLLHRDISINNLMINNQTNDPDRKSFLIDLDVAIAYPIANREDSYARTGTKVFMSVSLLEQENPHDFVDDLESFFWVLIWICIHYPLDQRTQSELTEWNHQSPTALGAIKNRALFKTHRLTNHFTSLYANSQPLINCVQTFAEIMRNPNVRMAQSETLYDEILGILRQARQRMPESLSQS
ncbi:hypothetical protein PGTUg99_016914 [Puccinia graminis f. sp. tritici]|uniref:Fungal-type protein kinase domain-containing protein n=1 Tax=Puccinia graminis f. sp. tritici TaxID=56615 RepID=A0A5B0SJU0_PUCGR|nr:hypothetical protein PGTUg99_016914 [Puccinia graminis f. sp. tritici]